MRRKLDPALVALGIVLLALTTCAARVSAQDHRVLRLARPTDPQTLDPALSYMQCDLDLLPLVHLTLLDVVDGTRLTNNAAREWKASADARTYTFLLRPEIKFSNGNQVVAADYAYAFERMLDPRTASPGAVYLLGIRGAAEYIKARTTEQAQRTAVDSRPTERRVEPTKVAGISAPNSHTLVIELERPDPTFPYVMAIWPAAPVPRKEVERLGPAFGVHPVGTGPYLVEKWSRGTWLVLAPNPYYAGREPRHFDRIEIMVGGDTSTHLMMFERGELDIADIENFRLPLPDHVRITRQARWRSCVERGGLAAFSTFVTFNTEMPPLDNPKVRRALNYAVDKPRRLRSATGRCEPAKGLIPPFVPGYNPAVTGYPFDPQKAKTLLAESGVARPIRLTLWHGLDLDSRTDAEGIQSDLQGIGVQVELKPVTLTELFSAAANRGTVQMALAGWVFSIPDPRDLLAPLFDGRTITNKPTQDYSFYNNAEVNRLVDEAAANPTLSARFALYRQAEEIIVRDAPALFLGHPNIFALKQPWIKGRLIEPLFPFRLDRVWRE